MKHCLYNYIYSIHLQKGFFVRVYEYTKALKFEKNAIGGPRQTWISL